MVIVALNNLSCRALAVKAHDHFLNEHNTADESHNRNNLPKIVFGILDSGC
jgi:hypothetical protein